MRLGIAVLCAAVLPALAAAGEVEATVRAGQVFPFYKQTVHFDPGPFLRSTFPGVIVDPVQDLRLEGRGGLALGGGLTWYAAGGVGLQARIDTADVSVTSIDAIVRVRLPLPPPLPTFSTDLTIPATADLQRLRPVSLNLAARTSGNVKVHVSGGVSYLPALRFSVRSEIQAADPLLAGLPLARLTVRAEAEPGGQGEGRLGFNAGAGFGWPLSGRLSLEVDARYFRFRRQTLAWTADPGVALTPVEQQLMRQLLDTLGPVTFNPEFFQATGGLTVRF
jgi:opacity protein-like surface antigen